jgi:hypothetical protein
MSGSSSTIKVVQRVVTPAQFVVTAPSSSGRGPDWPTPAARPENRRVEVAFRLGPVGSTAAKLWLDRGLEIVAALRRHPTAVPFTSEPALLDLIDMYFTLWSDAAAAADPLEWRTVVDSAIVETIALHWRRIAAMDADQIAVLGCSWPPPEALAFHDALLAAVTDALVQDAALADLAADLLARPPGTPAEELGGW